MKQLNNVSAGYECERLILNMCDDDWRGGGESG